MSATALQRQILARAARVVEYRGVETAALYDDVEAEWYALDSGAGLVDLSYLTDIVATGDERIEFLQGQVSQDLSTLGDGGGAPALALSAQGKVEAMMALYDGGDGASLEIVVDRRAAAAARARLEQFLVADDVEFEDGPVRDHLGVVGPRAADLLREAGCELVPSDPWQAGTCELAGSPVTLRARGELRVPCVEIAASDAAPIWELLESKGAVPAGVEAQEIVRVESGTPLGSVDVDDTRIAVEARLEWAIHFAKGCYVGQEVIERAVSRGRLNREIALLGAASQPSPGDSVRDGSDRDVVTSVVRSPALGWICLAYLPRDHAEPGSEVALVGSSGSELAATVLDWPRSRALPGR